MVPRASVSEVYHLNHVHIIAFVFKLFMQLFAITVSNHSFTPRKVFWDEIGTLWQTDMFRRRKESTFSNIYPYWLQIGRAKFQAVLMSSSLPYFNIFQSTVHPAIFQCIDQVILMSCFSEHSLVFTKSREKNPSHTTLLKNQSVEKILFMCCRQ